MSLTLTLHTEPEVPLEAPVLSPDSLRGLKESEVSALAVYHGNRTAAVGDFFQVTGRADEEVHVQGNLARVKHMGTGMSRGHLLIHGDSGAHLGAAMRGGVIEVEGNAGEWVGPEMSGGRIVVKGNAKHMVGSAYRGSAVGMQGGEIIIHGNAGNEVGHAMRAGLIAIGGNSGDFVGVNMLAGTIIVLGEMGIRCGAGMKRGTIVCMHDTPLLPTFTYACTFHPTYLRLYLLQLQKRGLDVAEDQISGKYRRWSGDSVELNRGEVLVHQAA